MKPEEILKKIQVSPSEDELSKINEKSQEISESLKSSIGELNIGADVFIGGSFAKGTLVKNKEYDIDFFIRFDWKYEGLSKYLEKIVKKLSKKIKLKPVKVHGSRDYFRFKFKNLTFEIIPVTKIKKPEEARNVTDLSYFHVKYLNKKINKKLSREIKLAKKFFIASKVYGAESYIQGFSGYATECLVIHYGSFLKMAHALSKVKERIILDPEKQYKKKQDVLFSVNESKLQSPVILIDPTWKERNVLAALSDETFRKTQKLLKEFLKNPTPDFFIEKPFNLENFRSQVRDNAEFLHLKLKTNRQEGDIAGTKMKKFSNFLKTKLKEFFIILDDKFIYSNKKSADYFIILKPKKEVMKIGPPLKFKDSVKKFKESHSETFEKNGYIHANISPKESGKLFIKNFKKKNKKVIKKMGITKLSL